VAGEKPEVGLIDLAALPLAHQFQQLGIPTELARGGDQEAEAARGGDSHGKRTHQE